MSSPQEVEAQIDAVLEDLINELRREVQQSYERGRADGLFAACRLLEGFIASESPEVRRLIEGLAEKAERG